MVQGRSYCYTRFCRAMGLVEWIVYWCFESSLVGTIVAVAVIVVVVVYIVYIV